jgi:hypothetical protein
MYRVVSVLREYSLMEKAKYIEGKAIHFENDAFLMDF